MVTSQACLQRLYMYVHIYIYICMRENKYICLHGHQYERIEVHLRVENNKPYRQCYSHSLPWPWSHLKLTNFFVHWWIEIHFMSHYHPSILDCESSRMPPPKPTKKHSLSPNLSLWLLKKKSSRTSIDFFKNQQVECILTSPPVKPWNHGKKCLPNVPKTTTFFETPLGQISKTCNKSMQIGMWNRKFRYSSPIYLVTTVDGRNPAPPGMYKTV